MKTIIYQIGRIDSGMFSKLSFVVEGKSIRTDLSSFAIKEYLSDKDVPVEVVLLYPVSLPFQPFLLQSERFKAQCDRECLEALKRANENPADHLENPEEFFKLHPHTKTAHDFLVLHSFGTYNTLKGLVSLQGHYADIVLKIVLFMIKRYLSDPAVERYIIDISSGHNIYVSALINAVRHFCIWLKLYRWGQTSPLIETAIAEPVIPGVETDHRIYFEKLDAKAMLASPLSRDDVWDYRLSRIIYSFKNDRKKKGRLHDILLSFATVFSAIKNNVPLIIYHDGYHGEAEVNKVLRQLVADMERLLYEGYKGSPGLDRAAYIKTLLALGFYSGLIRILKEKGIHKSSEQGAELQRIRKTFGEIYSIFHLRLNDTILGNEVDKLSKDINGTTKWTPLIKCLRNGSTLMTSPQKRNFFAHAGFEKNVTECKVVNEDGKEGIYLRYSTHHLDMINNWILEALDE